MNVVISGGGTGGHIYPAVSVGQALLAANPKARLLFVGSSHGPEGAIYREMGMDFKSVPSSSLARGLSVKDISAICKLFLGVFRAKRILDHFQADVVLGTGGYTSAAVLLAQRIRRGKVAIHEQNAVPGRTNIWLSRIANLVCVTFEASSAFFKNSATVHTGMPVRAQFASLPPKPQARDALGLPKEAFVILIVGGSQGARKLNELAWQSWPSVRDERTHVIHQVGAKNTEGMESCVRASNCEKEYHIYGYLDMPVAMAAADLVVSRSGASTLAEISAARLTSVLVPFPFAYADHQRINSTVYSDAGAAVVFDEAQMTSKALSELVRELRSDPERRADMSSATAALHVPDAAQRIAQEIMNLL